MKKVLFSFLCFLLLGFSQLRAQEINAETVKKEIEDGLISFVSSVKDESKGHTNNYEEFRLHLIGEKNVETITEEGNALLSKTYKLIVEDASEKAIINDGMKEFAGAFKFMLSSEIGNLKNANLEEASIKLFGGNESKVSAEKKEKKCKWYQIGCHLSNLWSWLMSDDGQKVIKTIYQVVFIFYGIGYIF
jgi:hypothetical protein